MGQPSRECADGWNHERIIIIIFLIYIMSVSLGTPHSVFLGEGRGTSPAAWVELGAAGPALPWLLGPRTEFGGCNKSWSTRAP